MDQGVKFTICNPDAIFIPSESFASFGLTEEEFASIGLKNGATCPSTALVQPHQLLRQSALHERPLQREYVGSTDYTVFYSTIESQIDCISLDGIITPLRFVPDSLIVDAAMQRGADRLRLQQADLEMLTRTGAPGTAELAAITARRNNPTLKFLQAVNEYIAAEINVKSGNKARHIEYNADAIYIVRMVNFVGTTETMLKANIAASDISPLHKQYLRSVKTNIAKNGQYPFFYKHAMFVYKIKQDAFKNRFGLLSKATGSFFSLSGSGIERHPLSNKEATSQLNESALNASLQLVFHNGKHTERYVNILGTAYAIPQVRDDSLAEGFYAFGTRPAGRDEVSSQNIHVFISMAEVTEDRGFYYTAESAERSSSLESIAALRKKELEAVEVRTRKNAETAEKILALKKQESEAGGKLLQSWAESLKILDKEMSFLFKDAGKLIQEANREAERNDADRKRNADREFTDFLREVKQMHEATAKAAQDYYAHQRAALKAQEQAAIEAAKEKVELLKVIASALTISTVIFKALREFKKGK